MVQGRGFLPQLRQKRGYARHFLRIQGVSVGCGNLTGALVRDEKRVVDGAAGGREENQGTPTVHPEIKPQRVHHPTKPRGTALQTSMGSRHRGLGQLGPQTPTRRKVQSKEMAPKRRRCNKMTMKKL